MTKAETFTPDVLDLPIGVLWHIVLSSMEQPLQPNGMQKTIISVN